MKSFAAGARGSVSSVALVCLCLVVVAACTLLRVKFASTVGLRVDEAYYWTWSKESVVSFLDHPPLIAWCVRLGTALLGDTNLGVRLPGLVSVLAMQALLGAIVWRTTRDVRYVAAVVLLPEASLDYGLLSRIAPDTALIPCSLALIWALVRLAQSGNPRWWLAAGLFGGLALLSKYTAVLLLPAIMAYVLIPGWSRRQLASPYPWIGAGIALLVFSPVLYWNATHGWASFAFQLNRPAQVSGWSARFLVDFVGQQFALVGLLLLPIVLAGTFMLARRGYRDGCPVAILLSTSVIVPLAFFAWHGLSCRVGDSWPLFVWPIAFASAAINLKRWTEEAPASRMAGLAPPLLAFAIVSGIAVVTAAQLYYIAGTANYLKSADPIGKESGFGDVVAAAERQRNALGASWFATTDYRIYSMLRWHLRDSVPVVEINERAIYRIQAARACRSSRTIRRAEERPGGRGLEDDGCRAASRR